MFLSGIDIGGTSIKFGIFDEQLNLLQQWSRPTPKEPAEAAALIAAQLEPYHVAAIGAGAPGTLNAARETITADNLAWVDVPLAALLRRASGLPAVVINDGHAAMLAEMRSGALQNVQTGILLTLGTGIGGGIVINGQCWRSPTGLAPELGHMALRRTDVKWLLTFALSTLVLIKYFSVWYSCTLEYCDDDAFFAIIAIAMEYYASVFTLNSIVGWISKKREEEKSLIRYKNNKSLLRAVEMGIEEKQKLLNQQSRAIEIIALLNACGSSTVSIQENQNNKRAENIKTQLAELEAQRAKIEFSIEAYEESKAK